jgi:hypothetical protein
MTQGNLFVRAGCREIYAAGGLLDSKYFLSLQLKNRVIFLIDITTAITMVSSKDAQ